MQDLPAEAFAEFLPLLSAHALWSGVSVSPDHIRALKRYAELLGEWGKAINLTAIRDPEQIVRRHFLDSLALASFLPPSNAVPTPTLLDVGSGAGFPGVLCALFRKDYEVTLCERIGKKNAFLLALRRELGLSYRVLSDDANFIQERFGVVVSRAVLPLPDWLRLGQKLLVEGGFVYAMTQASEKLPSVSPTLTLKLDRTYDVDDKTTHRVLAYTYRPPIEPPTSV
ncbi:MAG TPA: 16S rRNA (guanine(527)-N(7))-methyltransferase RsmG [Pseudomonadota bacterium]|nr:16S rRNA (guanine(527)-N(7))-methyltransferase RsmG [Pseudomonadota bacterium]